MECGPCHPARCFDEAISHLLLLRPFFIKIAIWMLPLCSLAAMMTSNQTCCVSFARNGTVEEVEKCFLKGVAPCINLLSTEVSHNPQNVGILLALCYVPNDDNLIPPIVCSPSLSPYLRLQVFDQKRHLYRSPRHNLYITIQKEWRTM